MLDTSSVLRDLDITLEKARAWGFDYFVPIPRKAVKLLERARRAPKNLVHLSALRWSPTLANLSDLRVAIFDDSTLRGRTMREASEEVASHHPDVQQAFAMYSCTDPVLLRRIGGPDPSSTQHPVEVTRDLRRQEYKGYHQLMRHVLATENASLELDQVTFRVPLGPDFGSTLDLAEVATEMGHVAAYGEAFETNPLALTVLAPHALKDIQGLLNVLGMKDPLVKLRLYYSLGTSELSIVPMVFGDLQFEKKEEELKGDVWRVLQNLAEELGCPVPPPWPQGAGLRSSARLVYALAANLLALELGRKAIERLQDSEVGHLLEPGDVTCSLGDERRFGPDLIPLVGALAEGRNAELGVLRLEGLLSPPRLVLPIDPRESVQVPAPEVPEETVPVTSTLEALCLDITSDLRMLFERQLPEKPANAWVRKREERKRGLSFWEICQRRPHVPPVFVSQAIDFLCDQSFITPWDDFSFLSENVVSRLYRTAEEFDPTEAKRRALDTVRHVIWVARSSLDPRRGLELTFAQKLLTNVVEDARQMVGNDTYDPLSGIRVVPDLFGPTIRILGDPSAGDGFPLTALHGNGVIIEKDETETENPRKLIREGRGDYSEVDSLEPRDAHVIWTLTTLYCDLFSRAGSTVKDVLLPLAVYKRRDQTYGYLHKDLSLWVSYAEAAADHWDDYDDSLFQLDRAWEAIGAFRGKQKAATQVTPLIEELKTLAREKAPTLVSELTDCMDPAAVGVSSDGNLEALADLIEKIHPVLLERRVKDRLEQTTVDSAKGAIKAAGVSPSIIEDWKREVADHWCHQMAGIVKTRLNDLPVPEDVAPRLHRDFLMELDLAKRAKATLEESGSPRIFLVCVDIVESKALRVKLTEARIRYREEIEGNLRRAMTEAADLLEGELVRPPIQDRVEVFLPNLDAAISVKNRLEEWQKDRRSNLALGDNDLKLRMGICELGRGPISDLRRRIAVTMDMVKPGLPLPNPGWTLFFGSTEGISGLRFFAEIKGFGIVYRFD